MEANKDGQLMDIDEQERFIKNYQAVYYAMNAKPDCKSKIFPKDVIVEFSDLNELNRKIVDKFKSHYEDAGFVINITVGFRDFTSVEFSSWTTFEKYDFSLNCAIDGITIVWEYNAKLPKYQLPQKHTLTVRLADELRPQDVLNLMVSGKLSEMDLVEQEFCPVVARVDFINSILGDELLAIVDTWVNGITLQKTKNSFFSVLGNNKRKVAYAINYITSFVCIWCCWNYFKERLFSWNMTTVGAMSIDTFYDLLSTGVALIMICVIVYKLFFIIANVVFRILDDRRIENHTFNLTKGDRKVCQEIQKRIHKNYVKIIFNLVFTLIFNICCSILANILTK